VAKSLTRIGGFWVSWAHGMRVRKRCASEEGGGELVVVVGPPSGASGSREARWGPRARSGRPLRSTTVALAKFDPDTWGTVAEWVSAIGALLAFAAALGLLIHEISARKAAEEATKRGHEEKVARDLLRLARPIYDGLLGQIEEPEARALCRELRSEVELQVYEFNDEELRTRLHILRLVAFTVGWGEDKWQAEPSGTSWWSGVMRLRMVLNYVIWSLESYAKGDKLPGWGDDLPPIAGYAQTWALSGKKSWTETHAAG
jgi:hypothetical protein